MINPFESKQAFAAHSRAVKDLLMTDHHFYIPSYQRQYSWEEKDVRKLLSDVIEGIELLVQKDNSFTFIGSLITVKNGSGDAIHPKQLGESPEAIQLVIDGQQRLTTIFIICLVLHNILEVQTAELLNTGMDPKSSQYDWVVSKKSELRNRLQDCLLSTRAPYNGHDVYYPKMIRAHEDKWARSSNDALYKSLLAKQVHDYSKVMSGNAVFSPEIPNKGSNFDQRKFISRIEYIQKSLMSLSEGVNQETDEPFFVESNAAEMLHVLTQLGLQPDAIKLKDPTFSQATQNAFFKLTRSVAIAQYFLSRVSVAHIDCNDEDYAFAVFESLNTTGQPLNAVETLVPQVVQSIGFKLYNSSAEKSDLDAINTILKSFSGVERENAASALIIGFGLSESGEKIPKRLSDQKQYLQKQFRPLGVNQHSRAAFVKRLRRVSDVNDAYRKREGLAVPDIKEADVEDSELTFSFLADLKHTVALAPINRFYEVATSTPSQQTITDYLDCLKAVTAFSCLWRASRDSTGGIDNRYRTLMSGSKIQNNPGLSFAMMGTPDIGFLKKQLLEFLTEDGITSKSDFVSRSEYTNFYKVTPVARMLLLASHQDSISEPLIPGLIKHAGRNLAMRYLSVKNWKSPDFATIEHIAPKNPSDIWKECGIYNDDRLINTLGNFVLASQKTNSSFGNRDWVVKKVLYQALGTKDLEEAVGILDGLPAEDINIATQELMLRQDEQPQFQSLSLCLEFDHDFLKKRNKRLLELAYDNLIKHLKS